MNDRDRNLEDFAAVTARLRKALDRVRGKMRVADAIVLAGFDRSSFQRRRIVARAMRKLGWERGRRRFDGVLHSAYARGSILEREMVLDVGRDEGGRLSVKGRAL